MAKQEPKKLKNEAPNAYITKLNLMAKQMKMSYGQFSAFLDRIDDVEKYEQISGVPEQLCYVEKNSELQRSFPKEGITIEMINSRYYEALRFERKHRRIITGL